jgi:hypothetical protein
MSWKKIYPKVKTEKGLAFLFRNNGKSYLIKFAWNPMLLIEQAYIEMGWENFRENYKLAKEWKLQDKEIKETLEDAVSCAKTICRMIQNISDRGKAPLVVYVSDVA